MKIKKFAFIVGDLKNLKKFTLLQFYTQIVCLEKKSRVAPYSKLNDKCIVFDLSSAKAQSESPDYLSPLPLQLFGAKKRQ